MPKITIGTIIHGALGDCYEQLLAIKMFRANKHNEKWIGFFAASDRMQAMSHFKLDMLDEIYPADKISSLEIDRFFQFQIKDTELNENVIEKLPNHIKTKFDFNRNDKPWHFIRNHNFKRNSLSLELSDLGIRHLENCMKHSSLDDILFKKKNTIGYLWRYRGSGGAIKPYRQKSREKIIQSKSELFNTLIKKYNAHILISGMKKIEDHLQLYKDILEVAGIPEGEYKAKYTKDELNLPPENCTYLKGLGYAAEMEIMAKCNILCMMPSGFSEPLWMRRPNSVLLVDPPLDYILKLWYNRMPLFNNNQRKYTIYNMFYSHTSSDILSFMQKQKILNRDI